MTDTPRACHAAMRIGIAGVFAVAGFMAPALADDSVAPSREAVGYEQVLADCERLASGPMLPGIVDLILRGTLEQLRAIPTGPDAVAAAQQVLDALADGVGELDALPSLELQLLLAALAEASGDNERRDDRQAYAAALLEVMTRDRDGTSPARAFRPCLASNEYTLAAHALGVREVRKQSVVEVDGRSYDRLDVRLENGRRRTFYFDITDILRVGGRGPAP